jgi:hypothetical protein
MDSIEIALLPEGRKVDTVDILLLSYKEPSAAGAVWGSKAGMPRSRRQTASFVFAVAVAEKAVITLFAPVPAP